MLKEFNVNDYVYEESLDSRGSSCYEVTMITKISGDLVYGYWAMNLKHLPRTIKEFNNLPFDKEKLTGNIDVLNILEFEEHLHVYDNEDDYDEYGVLMIDECSMVDGYGELVDLKAEIVSNLINLDNYDSKILMGLANLSQEEAMDYFINIVIPNTVSIVQSSEIR